MVRALFTVLENEAIHADPIFILGPTAVVNSFCKNHDCDENDAVQYYVNHLEAKIFEHLQMDLSVRAVREKVGSLMKFVFYTLNHFQIHLYRTVDNITSRSRKHWANVEGIPFHDAWILGKRKHSG